MPIAGAVSVRRALAGGLCGLAAVAGPLLLDLYATSALEGGISRYLGRRLGAKVRVARVRPVGLGTLRLDGLSIAWPGEGPGLLTASSVTLELAPRSLFRLRPALARIALVGGTFRWEREDARAGLRRIYRRWRARAPGSPGRAASPAARTGLRLELELVHLLIRERRPRRAGIPTRLEARGLRVRRSGGGKWQGSADLAQAGLASGARLALAGVRWRGRDRAGGGLRVQWTRVQSGQWTPPGRSPGRAFTLVADELAPDLLQVRMESATAAPGDRLGLQADVDGRKQVTRARLAVGGLRLGTLYPWPAPAGIRLQGTTLAGALDVETRGTGWIEARGRARLTNLVVRHRRFAAGPVAFPPLTAEGTLRIERHARRLTLEKGAVITGGITLRVQGELQWRPGTLNGRGRVTLAPTACARLFAAVPPALAPSLQGLRLAGALGGELTVAADSRALKDLTLEVHARPSACRVVRDAPRADVAALRRPFTFVIRPPGWQPTRLVMGPESKDWVPFARLGRNVIGAFLAAEDRRFFGHKGFDVENIRRALAEDLRVGGFAKGASSISQQVAKNVFLTHRRNLSRKVQEAVLTWRLEQVLDKRRILEIYLNLVEMGPGLFGVRAAARHYFQREPRQLDPIQAAHLAAITPNPRAFFERFKDGRAGMDWLLHLRWLLFQMHRIGWLDKASYERYRLRDLRLISYH